MEVPKPTTAKQTARQIFILFALTKNKNMEYVMDNVAVKSVCEVLLKYCKYCSTGAGSFYSVKFWDEVETHLINEILCQQ